MKKKTLSRSILKSMLLLSLIGGMGVQLVTVPIATAETIQTASYNLTDEEKAAVREYTEAKLALAMQDFYLAFFEGMMNETTADSWNTVWEEEVADLNTTLTNEQVAVLDEIKATLIGSIGQHYHYLFETLTVAGKSGREEAANIVAKYEATEDEELRPEVELAMLTYAKEIIIEILDKNAKSIDNYVVSAEEKGQNLRQLLENENLDLEAIKTATVQYGQELSIASQPKFPYDFSEIDTRIIDLKMQLQTSDTSASITENPPYNEDDKDEQQNTQIDDKGSIYHNIMAENISSSDKQQKILPKTSDKTGTFLMIMGLIVGLFNLLFIYRNRSVK
ncbi:LPXTG cell wall anchor domain-containing protein [Streptococcus suis]|nr:LPXTG cell wall anchor domain-containing protein [Streptococcus suis]